MQVKILDQTLKIENEHTAIESLFDQIEQLLNEEQVHIGSMTVDGEVIYEEYKNYIQEHIQQVKVIEIETLTLQQYFNEVLLTADKYLKSLIPGIAHLSGQFYKNLLSEAWNSLSDVMEGLQWVNQVINAAEERNSNYANLSSYQHIGEELSMKVKELLSAVQAEDTTLIGDILQYEILDLLTQLEAEIQKTIDNEVVRHDVN